MSKQRLLTPIELMTDERNRTIDEIKEIFNEEFFNRFAWNDGTMNFNNCSLMMLEILEQLKEQTNE